jgi:tRNA-binding protein
VNIEWSDFEKVDMRVGRIVAVDDFPKARNPSYRITVDFGGDIGVKKSCAQITSYSKEELLGKQVICVVNFPPKQIANAISEVLILGLPHSERGTILLAPDTEVECGGRVY